MRGRQATPNNVIVMSSVGPWESVGGDIKFLRLKQLNVGGIYVFAGVCASVLGTESCRQREQQAQREASSNSDRRPKPYGTGCTYLNLNAKYTA